MATDDAAAQSSDDDAGPAEDARPSEDARPADSGLCIDVDLSTYDTSCEVDSDCILVTGGRMCDGRSCPCGGASINVDGQARYEAVFSTIHVAVWCECQFFGSAQCVHGPSGGVCTYCPSPGCRDGG
jgi:hypothetical protein